MKRKRPPAVGPYLLYLKLDADAVESFEEFPLCLPVIKNLVHLDFHPRVTFFVGENGSGKSTLLEALAVLCRLNPEGGSKNLRFASKETHSQLDRYLRLARSGKIAADSYFLRAESFYNVATALDEMGEDQNYHRQSHGESFLALLQERFLGSGLYLMDEPEAALSPQRQLTFLAQLHHDVTLGAQFIIATHSPIIMAYPDAWIYNFTPDGIHRIGYEETQHFQITQAFLLQREKMLKTLMNPPLES